MTEIDIRTTLDSDAPTLYLGFSNVLHRGEAWLDTFGHVTLESGGKPFGDTHHLLYALAPYPNLQVVLTTTWTWWLGDTEVIAFLPEALGEKVIATTREFPPKIEEAECGCGFVGTIIRHAAANGLTKWLAIGSDFRGVPSHLTSRFLQLANTGLEASSNRKALQVWLKSNLNE